MDNSTYTLNKQNEHISKWYFVRLQNRPSDSVWMGEVPSHLMTFKECMFSVIFRNVEICACPHRHTDFVS